MASPVSTKSWRKLSEAIASTGIATISLRQNACSPKTCSGRLRRRYHRLCVVNLHGRVWFKRAQRFVTAGNNFIALLQSVGHFDVRGAQNSRLHLHKNGLAVPDHEYTL